MLTNAKHLSDQTLDYFNSAEFLEWAKDGGSKLLLTYSKTFDWAMCLDIIRSVNAASPMLRTLVLNFIAEALERYPNCANLVVIQEALDGDEV